MMRLFGRVLGVLLIALAAPSPAQTNNQAPTISTRAFAALPTLRRPILSPDGRRIVARSTVDGNTRLILLNADAPEARAQAIPIGETGIQSLRWAGNDRLLLTMLGTQTILGFELPFLRLIAIDTGTGASRLVDPKSRGMYAGDVLYTDPTGSWALVASQDDLQSYPSVKRVDLATGKATLVEKAKRDVWDWYADDKGVVRAGIAIEGRRWTVWYRQSADQPLRAIKGKVAKDDDSSIDKFIFGNADSGWIVTNERTGRFAVYKYDFATSSVGEAVFEHPTADIDDVLYDPLSGTISGLSYHDTRQRTVWFDPERKALQARIDRALPDAVNSMTDWSTDKQRVLVWSSSASDPGRYFLLDRKTSRMHPVVEPYPSIDPSRLAEVKPVQYSARDGLTIPAYLTLPPGRAAKGLPLVIMPHGGPFARDEWTYSSLVQFVASRGYAVFQPQFRGSTGYGKDFVSRGYGEYGRKMQDDLDDGVDWLVRTGQVDPKRVCIVGASYGGYAALWGAIRNPERYRCAASMAGVTDLDAQLRYDRKSFSATRYFREWRTKVAGAGKFDLKTVSPLTYAARMNVPVLIAHGEADSTVPVKQSQAMVAALTKAGKNVTSVFYKQSDHDFGTTADYEDFLKRLEQFLARYNPA